MATGELRIGNLLIQQKVVVVGLRMADKWFSPPAHYLPDPAHLSSCHNRLFSAKASSHFYPIKPGKSWTDYAGTMVKVIYESF
jgi:hypothetical protein